MDLIGQWVGFFTFVLLMLAVDLGVFHKKSHAVSLREAGIWSVVWVVISLLFGAGVYHFKGQEQGLQFITGYLIEKALSVDNLFVFVVIFSYFKVDGRYQHRVLFWGIMGAFLMRGVLIATGTWLVGLASWLLFLFGALLIWTGFKLLREEEGEEEDFENKFVVRLFKRFFPVSVADNGAKFFVREPDAQGRMRLAATSLFVVLLLVEVTDLLFAFDSIPAILAISKDPFILVTSNVCAILGLRAMYFLLAAIMPMFRFLQYGLAIVLMFVGTKMILHEAQHYHWKIGGWDVGFEIPIGISLGIVGGLIALSVVLSLVFPAKPEEAEGAAHAGPTAE